nr:hypothetical protein [Haladaptatus litoreus]
MVESDDEIFSFEELVGQFVSGASNVDVTVDETVAKRRDRIAIALHHSHLPKLADFGIIEYDMESKTTRYEDFPVDNLADWMMENRRISQ